MYFCKEQKDQKGLNSLPHDNILDWSRFKALADDKINITKQVKFVFERVESIVGKGENAGYQHFLLFPQFLQKGLFLKVVKSQGLCGKGFCLLCPEASESQKNDLDKCLN